MSILIKGMEMPTSCWNCPVDKPLCTLWQGMTTDEMDNGRHKDCPLVHIPPHGDLIDRDALPTGRVEWEDIVYAPTIIPAEEGE